MLNALAANGGNAKKTAKMLGVPRSTLRYAAGRSNAHGKTPSPLLSEEKRSELSDKWKAVAEKGTAIALQALEGIEPGDLSMRDVKDLLIGSAVATEKHQLLTGLPTSREGRQVVITFSDPGAKSLRELGERALSGTPALPEPSLEGAFVEETDKG